MAMSMDVFVRPFRGGNTGPTFEAFWKKFLVAGTLQKWDTDAKLLANLPLFLDDEAFLVWDELSDDDKKDRAKVFAAMQAAFSLSPAEAYERFTARTLRMDESVDSYAADLKKLLGQSGHTVASDGKDRILVEQFIVGLPSQYAREVRMNCRGNAICDHVEYVRRLLSADQAIVRDVSAVTTAPSNADHPRSVLCFSCRQLGHIARFCPQRTPARWGNFPICHFCDAPGHVKRDCQKREECLKSQNKSSTIASPLDHAGATYVTGGGMDSRGDMVLGTPASGGTLPRIYVNICSVGRPTRVVAAVDICSSRNLISQQLVASIGAHVSSTMATILAIDGTPLDVCGLVELTVEQTDGAVNLPTTSSKFIVVADLSTVRTDVVLGEELIAAVGGINLRYEKGCLCSVIFGQSPDLPIPVSNAPSMGGQEHIPELKHTPVGSETKPEVITDNRQLNGKSARVFPKPQQPAERVDSSDDTKQDAVASTLIASSTTNRKIATALKTVNLSAIPVITSSTARLPERPNTKGC